MAVVILHEVSPEGREGLGIDQLMAETARLIIVVRHVAAGSIPSRCVDPVAQVFRMNIVCESGSMQRGFVRNRSPRCSSYARFARVEGRRRTLVVPPSAFMPLENLTLSPKSLPSAERS